MIPNSFSQLIGNAHIKKYLQKMLDRKAIANSLLFAGPEGVGKSLFAQVLATELICEKDTTDIHRQKIEKGHHPDLYHYRPEGKLGVHSIQTLRQFSDDVNIPPYEANWKIFIIHNADRMLSYSANALLKTFEEPPPYAVIILLSHAAESILPTVISRCRAFHFQIISQAEIQEFLKSRYQLENAKAEKLAKLSCGSLASAVNLAENDQSNRDLILDVLAKGHLSTYKELTNVVNVLTERIEVSKKQREQEAKEHLYKMPTENLSALQHQALEKELEGIVAMSQLQEANSLFNTILFWYRDLHLISMNGKKEYLMNPDYERILEQVLQRGNIPTLEYIQKIIEEGRLSLQRSTSLQLCLENLFLKTQLAP